MVYKTIKLKNGQTAVLDWLKEEDLPEVVEALNSVIRERKYLLLNDEITDMEEERRWFEPRQKGRNALLSCKNRGQIGWGRKHTPSY